MTDEPKPPVINFQDRLERQVFDKTVAVWTEIIAGNAFAIATRLVAEGAIGVAMQETQDKDGAQFLGIELFDINHCEKYVIDPQDPLPL